MFSQTTKGIGLNIPLLVEGAILYDDVCKGMLEIVAIRPLVQRSVDLLEGLLMKGKVTHCKIETGVIVFFKMKTDNSKAIAREAIEKASLRSKLTFEENEIRTRQCTVREQYTSEEL